MSSKVESSRIAKQQNQDNKYITNKQLECKSQPKTKTKTFLNFGPKTYLTRNAKSIAKIINFAWNFKHNKKWITWTRNEAIDSCKGHK